LTLTFDYLNLKLANEVHMHSAIAVGCFKERRRASQVGGGGGAPD